MKLKVGNIITVQPSGKKVKVIASENDKEWIESSEKAWDIDSLVDYWYRHYDMELSYKVKRCLAIFPYSTKPYCYPIDPRCIKKLRFQFIQKRRWKIS